MARRTRGVQAQGSCGRLYGEQPDSAVHSLAVWPSVASQAQPTPRAERHHGLGTDASTSPPPPASLHGGSSHPNRGCVAAAITTAMHRCEKYMTTTIGSYLLFMYGVINFL